MSDLAVITCAIKGLVEDENVGGCNADKNEFDKAKAMNKLESVECSNIALSQISDLKKNGSNKMTDLMTDLTVSDKTQKCSTATTRFITLVAFGVGAEVAVAPSDVDGSAMISS